MEVGYACEYIENDKRDRVALAELSADLEEYFGDRDLIVFLPPYSSFGITRARVSYHEMPWQDTLEQRYGLGRSRNDGSQQLLRVESIGSGQDPHFVDPLEAGYMMDIPENTISPSELRERVNAVIAEEEERGDDRGREHHRGPIVDEESA